MTPSFARRFAIRGQRRGLRTTRPLQWDHDQPCRGRFDRRGLVCHRYSRHAAPARDVATPVGDAAQVRSRVVMIFKRLIECKNEIDYGSSVSRTPEVHTQDGVVVWTAGSRRAPVDVWFHPALGDSPSDVPTCIHIRVARTGAGACIRSSWSWRIAATAEGADAPAGCAPVVRTHPALLGIQTGRPDRAFDGGHCCQPRGIDAARAPAMVIGVEANLTAADAYFTGSGCGVQGAIGVLCNAALAGAAAGPQGRGRSTICL